MTLLKVYTLLILAVPAAAFALGLLCWRYPPQGPTWAFGFRSRRARASDESWLFAQACAGRIWFCLGLILVMVGIPMAASLRDLPVEDMTEKAVIFILIQDGLMLLSILPTEFLLLKKFDRFGRPRRRSTLPPVEEYEEEPMEPVAETEEEFEPLEMVDYADPGQEPQDYPQ